jgi:hypothetical protein
MAEGPGGVRAALAEVLDQAEPDPDEVQGVLFDALGEDETGALDAPSPLSALLAPAKGKGGRRPGSRNKRTEAVVAWLLSQHRHPLSVMMEAYSMTPAELAARIGLVDAAGAVTGDLLEIFKLQLRMAEAVAPYVAQRQPLAVQMDMKAGLTIGFEGVSLPARGRPGDQAQVVEGLRLPFKSDGEVGRDA